MSTPQRVNPVDPPPPSRDYDSEGLSPRKVWRRVLILSTVLGVFMVALLWKGERDSCLRDAGIRHGFNNLATGQVRFLRTAQGRARAAERAAPDGSLAQQSAKDAVAQYDRIIAAQETVKTLDCGGLFPDNQ